MEKSINRFSWKRVGGLIRMEYLLTRRMLAAILLLTFVYALGVLFVHHQTGVSGSGLSFIFIFTWTSFLIWLNRRIWKTEGIIYISLPAGTGEKWVSLLLISVMYGVMILAIWWLLSHVEVFCYPMEELTGYEVQSSYIFSMNSIFNSSPDKINLALFWFSVLFYALIRFRKSLYVFFVFLFAMIALFISLSVSEYLCLVGSGYYMWWYVLVVVMSVGFLVASYYALKKQQQK